MNLYKEAFYQSKYNHFYKNNDKYLGTNLLTWAILSLNEEQYNIVKDFLALEKIPQNEYEESIFGLLVKKKFINPVEFDEKEYLENLFMLNKQSEKSFSLGLALTLGCNFRCPYCYQDHPEKRMSRVVQKSILKYLEKELTDKESFSISWWGGEPLLETQIIKNLGKEIMDLCDKYNIAYNSSMSTNGYLLNNETIKILKDGKLKHLQVTIDGYKNSHNKTRILTNGEGTYDVILNNLYNLVKIAPEILITIRVNVGKNVIDIEGWKKLLIDLIPIKGSIAIAPREVLPTEDFDQLCLTKNEFDEYYDHIGEITYDSGFRIAFGVHGIGTTYCGAVPNGNWLIHPDGFIHKCTAIAHKPELSLGKLHPDGKFELYKDAKKWINYSPFESKKCKNCNFLPLCMGGCMNISFTKTKFVDRCRIKKELPLMIKNKLSYN